MSKFCIAIVLASLFSIPAVVLSDRSETEVLSAEDALAEYLKAEKAAKLECIKKLDAARLKAVADKKSEKARKILETKQALVAHDFNDALHPFVALGHEIKSTRWQNIESRKLWNRFDRNFQLKNAKGDGGNWAVVDVNAIVSTTGDKHIHLWVFDKQRNRATLRRFIVDTKYERVYVKSK